MFRTETHLHTAEVSLCGKKRASEMVNAYLAAGYSTIFISDHFQKNTLDDLGDISWEEKVSIFLHGYYRAKKAGDAAGLTVLPALEVCFTDAPNHYLVYGITRELLCAYPELHTYGIERFYEIAKKHGLFVIQAHPHRDGHCYPTPQYADGFEVRNSNPRHEDFSEKSEAVAGEYGLAMTGGSDAHRDEDVAGSGIETEERIETAEQFIRLVKEGKAKVIY
jgi:histidinol phosphatase-like PHP family hydrolase